ncbi:hypothetical protein HF521_019364 [Silurus meridionalis]|uniref:Uncharacterized protein n=1 Tax=Silurus meridionalis TaxID=175797 RepID=A0A8T0BL57_SILME|nr:hypothetical protein HF521_019364 [Silurus meridionalis]
MLMKANQDFGRGHHIVFDSIISKPMTRQSNLYVNVLLKVTTCIKTSKNAYEHRDECDTRKDNTPLIDCLVCKTYNEKELVDCGRKINVSKGKRSEIRNSCRPYRTGASNLMALKSEDKRKIEFCSPHLGASLQFSLNLTCFRFANVDFREDGGDRGGEPL